jgi:hypothetical protein
MRAARHAKLLVEEDVPRSEVMDDKDRVSKRRTFHAASSRFRMNSASSANSPGESSFTASLISARLTIRVYSIRKSDSNNARRYERSPFRTISFICSLNRS